MAVTAQADNPYQALIRKIGFSVGLEKLLERVRALVDLYDTNRGISRASFSELVEVKFKRKAEAVFHFAHFYNALNLIKFYGRELLPLYQLDSLAILKRLVGSDSRKYEDAVAVILTQALIEADGDIFL